MFSGLSGSSTNSGRCGCTAPAISRVGADAMSLSDAVDMLVRDNFDEDAIPIAKVHSDALNVDDLHRTPSASTSDQSHHRRCEPEEAIVAAHSAPITS